MTTEPKAKGAGCKCGVYHGAHHARCEWYAEAVRDLIQAVREYEREHTNPAKDCLLRARRRDEMFAALKRIGGAA